ncbi:MAG: hypothetical protein NPIRA02_01830 [Nitrospirales bacterium]|nr:MAG: hypothetical protein NPIRA02_01830 [Nitrospirales bacterium]
MGWLLGAARVSPGNKGLSNLTIKIGSWKTGRENVGELAQPPKRRPMNEAKTKKAVKQSFLVVVMTICMDEIISGVMKEGNQGMLAMSRMPLASGSLSRQVKEPKPRWVHMNTW